mgnify:CR=1 FL=1
MWIVLYAKQVGSTGQAWRVTDGVIRLDHAGQAGEHRFASLAIAGDIADLGHVYHPILEAFDADGRLVDHASPALGSLRKAVAALTQQLDRRMDELVKDPRYAPLFQDDFYTQPPGHIDLCGVPLPVRTPPAP